MSNHKGLTVFAPATIANFIVGFDCLGASIESLDTNLLGDTISLRKNNEFKINIIGKYGSNLPEKLEDNLVYKATMLFKKEMQQKNKILDNLKITLNKGLPICSGLGSSATSIVSTLVALNKYYKDLFSITELLEMAAFLESGISGSVHFDNVLPCLLGGLRLITKDRNNENLPWFNDWCLVVFYQNIIIETKKAREILPKTFKLKDTIIYWQNLAAFVTGLHNNDKNKVAVALIDKLIEPYRAKLILNFNDLKQTALKNKAIAFGISGSGPTCFAIMNNAAEADKLAAVIKSKYIKSEVDFCCVCKVSQAGARVLEGENEFL